MRRFSGKLASVGAVSLIIALLLCPAIAFASNESPSQGADASAQEAGDIASGTSGTCTWVIDANGLLTVKPTSGSEGALAFWLFDRAPWTWSGSSAEIKSVHFEGNVKAQTCVNMFESCSALQTADLSGLDTSSVTSMSSMFRGCSSLTSLDLSGLDTSRVTDISYMFSDCASLASLDISGFDVSSVRDASYIFSGCSSLAVVKAHGIKLANYVTTRMFADLTTLEELDLSNADTSSVTSMWSMFKGCSSLASLDLSGLDTSRVTDMRSMFSGCSSLASLDLSGLDTSSATSMWAMFWCCSSLTSLDLSGFKTSRVRDMGSMFEGCTSLTSLDLSGFDTSSATNLSGNHGIEEILAQKL